MKNVTILNFSSRNHGNCTHIADHIAVHNTETNVHTFVMDQRISPCNGCNYECLMPGATCPNVSQYQQEVMGAVLQSDVVYLIVPNYCGFPCANFLAFNERSVGYFNLDRGLMQRYMNVRKRFIIVSNTENEVFQKAMEQQTKDTSEVLYLKTSKYGKRSTAGDLMESPEAVADLDAFLNLE